MSAVSAHSRATAAGFDDGRPRPAGPPAEALRYRPSSHQAAGTSVSEGGHGHAPDAPWRRALDIVLALAILVLGLPLMVLTALTIVLDTPGPILYRQQRVGLRGRPFTMLKFRTMTVDAEAQCGPVWAARNDPRVTKVGAVIRRFRIDELPQLLNVLRGDMAVIGPRPERPCFVEHLSRAIPRYSDRHQVKPGITGWAQVNYPYGASIDDALNKLSFDLYYVHNRSLMLDIRIVLATVPVVLFQVGAR